MFFKKNHYIVSPFPSSPPHFQNISRNLQYAALCYLSVQLVVAHTTDAHDKSFANISQRFSKLKKRVSVFTFENIQCTENRNSEKWNSECRSTELQNSGPVFLKNKKILRQYPFLSSNCFL